MPKKLSEAAVQALKSAVIETQEVPGQGVYESRLTLPQQLDRKIYTEVNAALQEIGGTWNRKLKAHVFPRLMTDTQLAEFLRDFVTDGERPDVGKDFGFFETPPELADRMVELLGPTVGDRVLEPSAGEGALIKALIRRGTCLNSLDLIEIRPECEYILDHILENGATFDHNPIIGDFLTHEFLADDQGVIPYDKIIMNPPFSVPGMPLADIAHVNRALELLEPTEGKLVACMSPAWLTSSAQKAVVFRLMLGLPPGCTPIGDGSGVKHAPGSGLMSWKWYENPPGAFRASGTDVRSGLLVCWYER